MYMFIAFGCDYCILTNDSNVSDEIHEQARNHLEACDYLGKAHDLAE